MRPSYLKAFIMLILIVATLLAAYYMYRAHVDKVVYWVLIGAAFLVFALFFLDSFHLVNSGQTLEDINKDKERLSYCDDYFILDNPYLQLKELIYWENVEAIFLNNRPPLDGEYHNFEYSIFLNSEPHVIKYENQSWFNRLSLFSKPKRSGLPIIIIKDDSNRDFHTFIGAINKYLRNTHKDSEKYLQFKFGNEVDKEENMNKIGFPSPIKTLGFYKIFDLGNNLNDPNLINFRKQIDN